MKNKRTENFLELKRELENSFQNLLGAFYVHGEDGICISDIEFMMHEHNGKLEELYQLCNTKYS